MTDYFDDLGFSDRVLEDAEILSNSFKAARLKKSKPVMKWVEFYKDVFSMSLDLSEFTTLQRAAGASVVLVPKDISISDCLDLLSKKINCNLPLDTGKIENVRTIRKSYICYRKYKDGTSFPLLEVLLINLFTIYTEKKIYKNGYGLQHTVSRYGDKSKQIILNVYGSSLTEYDLGLYLLK